MVCANVAKSPSSSMRLALDVLRLLYIMMDSTSHLNQILSTPPPPFPEHHIYVLFFVLLFRSCC